MNAAREVPNAECGTPKGANRRRWFFVIPAFVLVFVFVWVWLTPGYDLGKVNPTLRAIPTGTRVVGVRTHWFDVRILSFSHPANPGIRDEVCFGDARHPFMGGSPAFHMRWEKARPDAAVRNSFSPTPDDLAFLRERLDSALSVSAAVIPPSNRSCQDVGYSPYTILREQEHPVAYRRFERAETWVRQFWSDLKGWF